VSFRVSYTLAAMLAEHRDALLARWRDAVLADPAVPLANRLPQPALIDHLPGVIDAIARCLADNDALDRLACGVSLGDTRDAIGHAVTRYAAGYTIAQALRELTHFRVVTLQLCEETRVALRARDTMVLHAAIDEGMATVAVEMSAREVRWREEILAIVSHDLRNPLGVALAAAARNEVDTDLHSIHKRASMIVRSGQTMNRLIDDLSDLGAVRAGKLALQFATVDADAMLTDALDAQQLTAAERDVELVLEHTCGMQVECDPARIQQVLANLLGNAIRAVPVHGHVWAGVRRATKELVFWVRDDGPGLAPDAQARLFDAYWRGKEPRYRGSGLGLTIARGIVEAHAGHIRVESEPGRGARFEFTIPLHDSVA
jgi:signal transduction histidine kinase